MLPMCVYYFYICHFKHWKCLESRNMKMFYITVLYTCILVYMWLLLPNVIGIPKFAVGSTMISYTEIHFQRWLQFCILRVRLKWWPWQGRQGSGQVINNSSTCWPTKCVGLIICIWIWFNLMFDAHINAHPHMHTHEHRHRHAHAVTQEFPHTYKTCSIDHDSIHLLLRWWNIIFFFYMKSAWYMILCVFYKDKGVCVCVFTGCCAASIYSHSMHIKH